MRGLQSRGYIAECFRLFHAKDGSKHVTLRTSVPFRGLIDVPLNFWSQTSETKILGP